MENQLRYILAFFAIALVVVVVSFFINKTVNKVSLPESTAYYTVKTFKKSKNNWYYEIYVGDILLVRQENIPAVSGIQLFRTRQDAETTGALVIDKLESNLLPTITLGELMENNIHFNK